MSTISYITSHRGSTADVTRCIRSVIADVEFSGIKDFEHLLFLDGIDEEACAHVINNFSHDSRVKIKYSKDCRGKAACVNALIRASVGEFLFFLDSDDWNILGRTRSQLEVIKREPGTIVGSHYYCWDGATRFIESTYPTSDIDIKLNFWRFPFLLYSSMCTRRIDIVGRGLYFNETLRAGIDYEFYSRAFQELLVKNTDEYLVCYRVGNKGGMTKSPNTRKEQLRVHREVMTYLLGLCAEKDFDLIDYLFSLITDGCDAKLTDSAKAQLISFKAAKFNRHHRRYFKNSISDKMLEDSLASILSI